MLDKEARIFWIAAQRIRLTPPEAGHDYVKEALDDLVCLSIHTESVLLANRCVALLDGELERCESSA